MTERTYGTAKWPLTVIESYPKNATEADMASHIRELKEELRELRAEVAKLKADAKRYRWLKANVDKGQALWIRDDPIAMGTENTAAWDEEIDLAIVEQELAK